MADSKLHAIYAPSPIDTSQVVLPAELQALVEKLAENAHDVWAAGRLAQGWVWGPSRCDERLHHPCIVSYGDLPEQEKEYDRASVVSTLKMIVALGYKIVKDTQR